MVAEIAGIVAGAVDEGGLTAAEELHSHEIQAGLIDDADGVAASPMLTVTCPCSPDSS